MDYVMEIENDGDELVFSDSGVTYSYVGRAALVGITPAGISPTSSFAGFSTYTIDWPGQITVALPVKANGATLFRSAVQSGSTWTITVYKGNGSFNELGFEDQEPTDVHVFGFPVEPPAGAWGVFFFDDSGAVTADLSRRPLSYVSRIATAAEGDEWPFPAGSYTPAVVGALGGAVQTSGPGPNNLFNIRLFGLAWRINGATGRLFQDQYLLQYRRDDAPGQTFTRRRPFNGLLVDVAGL